MTTLLFLVAAATAAPATVLKHHVTWTLEPGERLTQDVTWEVRIDDPAACVAGVHAPAGLDGAMHGSAQVLEDLLLIPGDTAPGTVFVLAARTSGTSWSRSGAFQTAPDLPVDDARVTVKVGSGQPLTLWHDEAAWTESASRYATTVSWSNVPAEQTASLVWSSWNDWFDAGGRLLEVTDAVLGSREDLGRDLAAGLGAIDVGSLAERVYREIKLEPGGAWDTVRPVRKIVTSGRGTAAERAVVLINLLRLAGYEAWPGGYARAGTLAPITVPAPALVPHPLVAVERAGKVEYIDPAADNAAVPALPATLHGGAAWRVGDLPVAVAGDAVVDGEVRLVTEAKVTRKGDLTWRTDLTAEGAALEHLRNLLVPLSLESRREAILKLLGVARPDAKRLDVDLSGVERPSAELRITAAGYDEGAFAQHAGGLIGTVPPVLATTLAHWLPPNIRVEERVAVTAPPDLTVLASTRLPSEFRAEAQVSRVQRHDLRRTVLLTEVLRPYRATSTAREAEARRFLDAEAVKGPEVMLYPRVSPLVVKQVRASNELDAAEKGILEAMLHLSSDDVGAATRAFKRAAKVVSMAELITGLERTRRDDVARLWTSVANLSGMSNEGAADRLAVAQAMERSGLEREAWLQAYEIHDVTDADTRLEALFLMLDNQGPRPDAALDAEGNRAWREPSQLVGWITAIAPDDPRLVRRLAAEALAEGDPARAEIMLEELVAAGDDSVAEVLLAQAAALGGVPLHEIIERVDRAVAAAPFDAEVAADAAWTMSVVGDIRRALDHGLSAARLAHDEIPLWEDAVDLALAAGDLPAALYAARRASDLAIGDPGAAKLLLELATLAGDEGSAKLARERGQDFGEAGRKWPVPVEILVQETRSEAVYALLQARDAEVVRSAPLLEQRARLRLARGDLDGAARDGLLLAQRHEEPVGRSIAFSAVVGRQQSSSAADGLYRAADESAAAAVVALEHDLLVGTNDVEKRARGIDHDRARRIAEVLADPDGLAQGWPAGLANPGGTPRDMRANRELGGATGVSAWSDPVRRTAILKVGGVTGLLPPPLGLLYQPDPTPLARLPSGGQLLVLRGGEMLVYAAVTIRDGEEIVGLGFTPGAAARALDQVH